MTKLCLNPACKKPRNPEQNKFCHGCGANLAESTQSYQFDYYRVTKLLGQGGFGRTYLAEYSRRYNQPRVIKKLITREDDQNQQKIKELFAREAEQLCHLDHPQIPKLYEYFEKENNLYLVQEFIDGMSLNEEFEQQGAFDEQKIQNILEELLPVLVYIEEQNLLHRDIKPDNIMRRRSDGVLMLIDFGAARVKTGRDPTVLTAIYTPGYAAIEHMMGKPVKASDVYSLGVTCIRLLTGCLPTGTTDLIYDYHENRLCWKEYLQERNIKVNDRLAAILDKMVASSLKDRYPDAQAVLEDLLRLNSPLVSRPTVNIIGHNYYVPPTFYLPSRTLAKSARRLGLLAGVVVILTGVVGIRWYFNSSQESINQPLLEKLEVQYQQGNYQDCYQLATDNSNQDNSEIQEWIGKCGLEAAKVKANAYSYTGAISMAQTIPNTVPNYQEVQDFIKYWQGKISKYQQEQAQSLISKTTGLDYNRLRDLIEVGKWQEADRETTSIMLQATGRQKVGWFRPADINKFPCDDLRIIDQLWLDSSQGKFGFSVQKEIWQRNGSPTKARGKNSLSDGQKGNLPSDIWEGQSGMWDVTLVELFSRVANCNR
ncbi:MAG: serine/threonine-protein kinase [Xenococcus sp. MO_188.B8]|nr:serine/threonine-protein kinase [Xenococcus sp. MO_188.B8]